MHTLVIRTRSESRQKFSMNALPLSENRVVLAEMAQILRFELADDLLELLIRWRAHFGSSVVCVKSPW